MFHLNYTEVAFNIKEEFITHTEMRDDHTFIFHLTLPVSTHYCPSCSTATRQIKDYRQRQVKLGCYMNVHTIAYYKQRRYVCPTCGKTFSEANPFVARYRQIANRVIEAMYSDLHTTCNYTSIAKAHGISLSSVIRYFSFVQVPKPKTLPTVLGIDEFRGNADREVFQTILTDARNREVVDILPSRNSQQLLAYFSSFSRSMRLQVRFITMDMSSLFRKVMQTLFPHAIIICDRYHICRLVDWAMERVRKREQRRLSAYSRTLKYNRRLLLKSHHTLTEGETIKLAEIFRISDDVRKAYRLKIEFRKLFKTYGKVAIQDRLHSWLEAVKIAGLPEFSNFFTSFPQWEDYIVNAFLLPYSNGYTEGCNNKIKVLKRISYGLRNFKRFRNRILLISKENRSKQNESACSQMRIAS